MLERWQGNDLFFVSNALFDKEKKKCYLSNKNKIIICKNNSNMLLYVDYMKI